MEKEGHVLAKCTCPSFYNKPLILSVRAKLHTGVRNIYTGEDSHPIEQFTPRADKRAFTNDAVFNMGIRANARPGSNNGIGDMGARFNGYAIKDDGAIEAAARTNFTAPAN